MFSNFVLQTMSVDEVRQTCIRVFQNCHYFQPDICFVIDKYVSSLSVAFSKKEFDFLTGYFEWYYEFG